MTFAIKFALVATLIAAISVVALGQKEKFDIELHVNTDEAIESDIRGVLKKELDTLSGVEPMYFKTRFRIEVVATVRNDVVAASVVVTNHYNNGMLIENTFSDCKLDPDMLNEWSRFWGHREAIVRHSIHTGSPDRLQHLVKDIDTRIDKEVLEPVRKSNARWVEYFQTDRK